MKKILFLTVTMILSSLSLFSQPRPRNYSNGGQLKMQNGYMRSNGTYVQPHFKTTPDNNKWNNKNYPR